MATILSVPAVHSREDLIAFYNKESEASAKRAGHLQITFWLLLMTVFVPQLLFGWVLFDTSEHAFEAAEIIGSEVLQIAAIIVIIARRRAAFATAVRSKLYRPVAPGELQATRQLLSRACSAVGVREKVALWYARDDSISPRVVIWQYENILLVPRRFVLRVSTNPGEALAILTHEVAHVRQDDVRLFETVQLIATVSAWVVLPLGALDVALRVLSGNWMVGLKVGLLCMIFNHRRTANACVAQSEQLADIAAILHSSAAALARAIGSGRPSDGHPDYASNRLTLAVDTARSAKLWDGSTSEVFGASAASA